MHTIQILRGPDRVRKRPAVIFMSDDIEGAKRAVQPILALFFQEARRGYCRNITVEHQGSRIRICGDDRGLYLGDGTDDRLWQGIFCGLYPAPRQGADGEEYAFGLIDRTEYCLFSAIPAEKVDTILNNAVMLDLCAFQCVCRELQVTAVRDGIRWELVFQKGYNQGGLRQEVSPDPAGTSFSFTLDQEVFTDTELPPEFFCEILRGYAAEVPGLTCRYWNTAAGTTEVFCFPAAPQ